MIAHVLDVQYSYCAAVKGVASPATDLVNTTTSKAAVASSPRILFRFATM